MTKFHVPFLQTFHEGELVHGKALGVKGEFKSKMFGASNFTINITTGENIKDNSKKDDVGLQLSCREKEGWILNSFVNRKWGDEERYPLNIREGEEFYVRIEPQENQFAVFVNGQKLCNYGYRMKLTYLNTVYVEGALELTRVAWEGQYYMVPFSYNLDKFGVGSTLYITGRPEAEAKIFDITFWGYNDDRDRPLTFSVRFGKEPSVVRNTKRNSEWMEEEKGGGFPFEANKEFEMTVAVKDNFYDIFVNGTQFCTFQHRVPPETAVKVHISGDLDLKSVYL